MGVIQNSINQGISLMSLLASQSPAIKQRGENRVALEREKNIQKTYKDMAKGIKEEVMGPEFFQKTSEEFKNIGKDFGSSLDEVSDAYHDYVENKLNTVADISSKYGGSLERSIGYASNEKERQDIINKYNENIKTQALGRLARQSSMNKMQQLTKRAIIVRFMEDPEAIANLREDKDNE